MTHACVRESGFGEGSSFGSKDTQNELPCHRYKEKRKSVFYPQWYLNRYLDQETGCFLLNRDM